MIYGTANAWFHWADYPSAFATPRSTTQTVVNKEPIPENTINAQPDRKTRQQLLFWKTFCLMRASRASLSQTHHPDCPNTSVGVLRSSSVPQYDVACFRSGGLEQRVEAAILLLVLLHLPFCLPCFPSSWLPAPSVSFFLTLVCYGLKKRLINVWKGALLPFHIVNILLNLWSFHGWNARRFQFFIIAPKYCLQPN